MDPTQDLPVFNMDADRAIPRITNLLEKAGLQVYQSFDLQSARTGDISCRCPYHGTDKCDCQMAVLLIYGHSRIPTTLVVHGHDKKTYLTLVDNPQQRPEDGITALIQQTLLTKQTTS
jgi:hypothetical protein